MASMFDDIRVSGTITVPAGGISQQPRSSLIQDANTIFPIPLADFRVWDAFGTNMAAAGASDDLGLVGGTFGTAPPLIQAGDVKSLGATTRYARVQVIVPECYDAAETLTINLSAGMLTTIADVSCVVDIECYRADKIGGISADLCTTAAQSINSLTFSTKKFVITATTLSAGDVLDMRLTITSNDAASATVVKPTVAGIDLVCDIRG